MLAGYPMVASNRLTLEVRPTGRRCDLHSFPGRKIREKTWQRWTVALPAGADAVRVHAVDGSALFWLAFSEPFLPVLPSLFLWPMLQLATTTCLALTLIYGPGLLWFYPGRALRVNLPSPFWRGRWRL